MAEPHGNLPADSTEDQEETDFATVAEATTIDEAKRKALDQLRKVVPVVDEHNVEFIVVEEGAKGGLFGRGKMLAQVEARLHPASRASDDDAPSGEELQEFVQTVVRLMGIDADVSVSETPDALRADVTGSDLGLLIGRHGSTIDALQSIASIALMASAATVVRSSSTSKAIAAGANRLSRRWRTGPPRRSHATATASFSSPCPPRSARWSTCTSRAIPESRLPPRATSRSVPS